jgi:NTE family protein
MTGDSRAAIVFPGGMGLGAYQAGAYELLATRSPSRLDWLAGASVGAVNAALIVGNPPERRLEALRQFWTEPNAWQPTSLFNYWNGRYAQNWVSAIQTRLFGAVGHFRPRPPSLPAEDFKSLYDLTPMRRTLQRLIDFERLNSGELRLTVSTTDVETGEPILFDTAREDLSIDHLMASCGMLPEFAPVQIGNRLLADGGLSANAPVESILADPTPRMVLVVDLFARDGSRPRSLTDAIERKNDLMFGNQTLRLLEFWRDTLHSDSAAKRVLYLSYRSAPNEAGSEKLFDLSSATVAERWQAGMLDMEAGLNAAASPGMRRLSIIRR